MPRFDARWPPFLDTESMIRALISFARISSSCADIFLRSCGRFTLSSKRATSKIEKDSYQNTQKQSYSNLEGGMPSKFVKSFIAYAA